MRHSASTWIVAGALAVVCAGVPALGQENRSGWMWTSSSDPYGAGNILGDAAKEAEMIRNFEFWGFDRIYTSLGSLPSTNPSAIARWNAGLDDAGIQSQMLLGEPTWIFPGVRPSLLNIVQTRLIDYNDSRADPREWIDGLHLDIEPHQLSAWGSGTDADRRDLLLDLRDTYADVRALLDSAGHTQVKIYADLPVWFDSSSQIGWVPGERDAWFEDIALSLEGISLMAFERSTFSNINNGVQWEINNFNGEVRVGLEATAVGPGKTWPDFDTLMAMAGQIETFYGASIGGVDFQPLAAFAELAEHAPDVVPLVGDLDGDGFVGIGDLNVVLGSWNLSLPQADPRADPSGDNFVGIADLGFVLGNWNAGVPPTAEAAVPEPASLVVLGLGGVSLARRGRHRGRVSRS